MDRFWRKVYYGNSCWEWHGARNKRGQGLFWLDGKQVLAHVASWILLHGAVPRGLCVMQLCANQSCVRPDHLCLRLA